MDFFDYAKDKARTREQQNQVVNNHLDDHEHRIRQLELLMHNYGVHPKSPETYETRVTKVPDGWLYITAFSKTYEFISHSALHQLIQKNQEFFKGHTRKLDKLNFVNPERVVQYFETGMSSSPQLNRQYLSYRKRIPELKEIAEKFKPTRVGVFP